MSVNGTNAKCRDVRYSVAIEGKADDICSMRVLPSLTRSRPSSFSWTNILIKAEKIVRVVFALETQQAVIIFAKRGLHPVRAFVA